MTLQNKINLITYPDSLGSNLLELHYVLRRYLTQAIGGVHILPFYPSSADRGFAPLTYDEVDPAFGRYVDAFRGEIMSVTLACGYSHPGEFTPHCVEVSSGPNKFSTLHEIFGYEKTRHRTSES